MSEKRKPTEKEIENWREEREARLIVIRYNAAVRRAKVRDGMALAEARMKAKGYRYKG